MKYLITGGAGFIGSHLCEELLKKGSVVCIDNFDNYYKKEIKEKNISKILKSPSFKVYNSCITDHKKLKEIFEEEKPDKVIHLAAMAGVALSKEQPFLYDKVNILGTLNLLELSKEYNIKKFIFASSSAVYGERKEIPFKETDQIGHLASQYASTKRIGEVLCYHYSTVHEIPSICLRLFGAYGPRGRPDTAPQRFTQAIANGETITLYGDGDASKDFTYISDIISGIISALDRDLTFEIINLGSSEPIELKDFISLIEEVVGKKAIIKKLPSLSGDVSKTYADIKKAKEILDWEPKISLKEGIAKTHEYYKGFQ